MRHRCTAGQENESAGRGFRRLALLMLQVAFACSAAEAFAQQPVEPVDITPIHGETYYMVNQLTGFQADLNGGTLTSGSATTATIRSFTSLTQRWAFTSLGSAWKISNLASGLCLDSATVGSTTSAVQNTCASTSTQQWILTPTSSGYYTLQNSGSGLVLDTANNAAGALLVQSALSTAATQSQQWLLRPVFFRGVDNALLEKQEANKVANVVPWWNDDGQKGDLLAILKSHGVNLIRIRPTSEPPYNTYTSTTCSGNGCYAETEAQDLDLAKRAKNLGMAVELSFLFDGGSSAAIPGSWSADTTATVATAVYSYVKAEIEAYRQAGAMPDMVAIGNEVDTGLMGSLASPRTSFSAFATVEQQGMQAVADASSDTSIGAALPMPIRCIHITPAYNLSSFFASANSNAIPYDAMCQSYYPIYHGPLTAAQAAASNPSNKPIEQTVLSAAATAIGKPIFLIEIGEHYENGFDSNDPWYAATTNGQRQFVIDVDGVLKGLPNNLGMGMEYWDATGVNVFVSGGGYSNADGKIDSLYQWNGLTIFDNADLAGYSNASLPNYSSTLPGLDALGGKLDAALSYKFVNKATGQILETALASTAQGSALDTAVDTGQTSQHQQWTIASNGDGYFTVANGNTAAGTNVLDASAGTTSGSTVLQNAAASTVTSTQEWNVVTGGGGYFVLSNHASGLVLAATSASSIQQTAASSVTTDGSVTTSSNQLWQIVPVHISVASVVTQLAFGSAVPATVITGNNLGAVIVDTTNSAGAVIGMPAAAITLTLSGPQSTTQTVTSSNGAASFNLSALMLSQPGTYTLTASATGLASATATIVVTYPPLTVTASNQMRVYGTSNPALTYTITGYLNGDTAAVVSGAPAISTTATTTSAAATYPIAVSLGTLQAANYSFLFANGSLVVGQAGSTIVLAGPAFVTKGQNLALTATVASMTSGIPTGSVSFYAGGTLLSSVVLVNGVATLSSTATTAGPETITAQYMGDTNFTPSNSNSLAVRVSSQNVWVANFSGSLSELSNGGAAVTTSALSGGGTGVAIDGSGFVWSAASSNTLSRFSPTGAASGTFSGGGLSAPAALVIDGSSNIWVANGDATLSLFSNAGTALSPASGLSVSGLSTPSSIAVDGSGSVWVANAGNSTVTRVLGAADPVTTPLANAVQNATTGTKP
jgi:arabinogalactan endo-1,4-beta-galactosidase